MTPGIRERSSSQTARTASGRASGSGVLWRRRVARIGAGKPPRKGDVSRTGHDTANIAMLIGKNSTLATIRSHEESISVTIERKLF